MVFSGAVTAEQRARLSSTDARMDSITFSDEDFAEDFLAQVRLSCAEGVRCTASGIVSAA